MAIINILYKDNALWLSRAASIVAEITGKSTYEYVKYLRFEMLKSLITHSEFIIKEGLADRTSNVVNQLYFSSIDNQDLGMLCLLHYNYIDYYTDYELWIKNLFRCNKPAILEMVIRDPDIADRDVGYSYLIDNAEKRGNTTLAALLKDLQKLYPE